MKTHLILLFMTGVFLLSCFVLAGQVPTAYGTIKRFENFPSVYVKAGNIDVWLPDGYNTDEKYAVLYMKDDQMLFDSTTFRNRQESGLDKTMQKLFAENQIRDCIVVGIWNIDVCQTEYFPQMPFEYLSDIQKANTLNTTTGIEKQSLLYDGSISEKYLKFLVLELKPFIDSTYSTLKDPASTFIAQSGMSGLISLYTICQYPRILGEADCLSTYWPGPFKMDDNPVPVPCLKYLNDNIPLPENHKIYFNYGTENLDPNYKPSQQQADLIMKIKDYAPINWISKTFAGAYHNERAWNKRFYVSLKLLFGK